jgi:signal transduction histidine kinase
MADTAWALLLRQIIDLGAEERNLRTALRKVAEFVITSTGADACFVHVVDRDAEELLLMGAAPAEFDEVAGTIRLRLGEGLAGWVARYGEATTVDNKWEDSRYRYIPALRGEEFRSMASVPLRRPAGVVGVLNVHSRVEHYFGEDDIARLREVASLLAGIVENAVLYDRLATREAALERSAADMIELQELDRRRIAADIHDGISQRLVSAYYHLQAARTLSGDDAVTSQVVTAESLVSDALAEARRAIVGLRPVVLDDLGLGAALTSLATSLGGSAVVVVEVDLDDCRLAPHVETALYRIAQEALQNVVKHANAERVVVTLRDDGETVELSVTDDGVGYEAGLERSLASYGLPGMRERAALIGAQLQIRSSPGNGTTVVVRAPAAAGGDSEHDRAATLTLSDRAPGDPRS